MNVAGVVKDWLLIAFSWSVIKDTVTPINLFGYGCRPNSIFNENQPDPVVQREWEKAQIREEIITSEIAHWRALEAEVRKELMAEWDWEMEADHRARQTDLSNDQSLAMRFPFMHHFNNHNRWRPEACSDLFSPPPQQTLPPYSFMLPPPVTRFGKLRRQKRIN